MIERITVEAGGPEMYLSQELPDEDTNDPERCDLTFAFECFIQAVQNDHSCGIFMFVIIIIV